MFPALAGKANAVCLAAAAVGMVIQGVAIFSDKWESRLIVRPQALAAASLVLFAGAALVGVMVFARCRAAVREPNPRQTINFYGSERTGTGTMFRACGPLSFEAQDLP